MDLLNELARTNIDPALLAQVQVLFAQQQAKLAEKNFKIAALTHELAYYRRVRFGKVSEALVDEQRLLFEETVDTDLAAIEEELESQAPAKRQRRRAGRQPLPPQLPCIDHRHESESCQCGTAAPTWSRSARTSASNWMLSRRASSCIAISVRSTPDVHARR